MDIPYGAWFLEPDMEDPGELMNQHQQICSYSDQLADSSSLQNYKGYQNLVKRNQHINAPSVSENLDIQESNKENTTGSFAPILGSTPNTFTISFGDSTSPMATTENEHYGGYELDYHDAIKSTEEMNLDDLLGSIQLPKRVSSKRRNHRQAQEHILAERKRREKLTQRFISLYALLPEIKKMDKATVLEDACKYIKHLQNRVKELEDASINGKNIIQESTASRRISKVPVSGSHEHDASSFDEKNSLPYNTAYNPEIKANISGSNILVRIYYQRNSLLALKVITEMERLHFTIMCNSTLPISSTTALTTVTAKMSEEFVVTATDVVKYLQSSLSNLL